MEKAIQVAVVRVALSNPAELTMQFSPVAKTTSIESKILIAVARADMAIVEYGPMLLAGIVAGLAVGVALALWR